LVGDIKREEGKESFINPLSGRKGGEAIPPFRESRSRGGGDWPAGKKERSLFPLLELKRERKKKGKSPQAVFTL